MERRVATGPPAPGALTLEATAALRALTAVHPDPLLLGVYPSYGTNPYQALLYQGVREHGIAPVRVRRAWQLDELIGLQRRGLPTVLHVHWLQPIFRKAESAKDAANAVDSFLGKLDELRTAGGHVAWTVHNVLSHEVLHEAEEVRLSRALAERSSVIHVMAERTAEITAPTYQLPTERLLVVPHMSYAGAYEDHVSPLEARHRLGLMPDELVFGVIGAIRPYKGLDALLDAWGSLAPGRRRLVIAGSPLDDIASSAFLRRAALDPTVILDARPIPPEEIQVFLRAADVLVLPYRESLNSGALLLGLTFGVPAIVPAGSGLADIVKPAFGRTYDPASATGLADALAGAVELATPEARAAARAAAAAVGPAEISSRFALGLRAMLGR